MEASRQALNFTPKLSGYVFKGRNKGTTGDDKGPDEEDRWEDRHQGN